MEAMQMKDIAGPGPYLSSENPPIWPSRVQVPIMRFGEVAPPIMRKDIVPPITSVHAGDFVPPITAMGEYVPPITGYIVPLGGDLEEMLPTGTYSLRDIKPGDPTHNDVPITPAMRCEFLPPIYIADNEVPPSPSLFSELQPPGPMRNDEQLPPGVMRFEQLPTGYSHSAGHEQVPIGLAGGTQRPTKPTQSPQEPGPMMRCEVIPIGTYCDEGIANIH